MTIRTRVVSRMCQVSTYVSWSRLNNPSFSSFVKLVQNFRSHNAILKFPNERFYQGDLLQCGESTTVNAMVGSPQLVSKDFPVVFHAVAGKDDREASSPSFFNIDEATQVKAYVEAIRADRKFRVGE